MQNEAIAFTGAAVPKDPPATPATSTPIDRRSLLARAAGAGAAGLLLGRSGIALQAPGSVPGAVCTDEALGPLTPELRRLRSYRIRVRVAELEFKQPLPCHDSNGDEQLYPDRRGNFSKSLLHDAIGEVVPSCYDSLLTALQSGDPDDFEAVQMGNPGGSGSVRATRTSTSSTTRRAAWPSTSRAPTRTP